MGLLPNVIAGGSHSDQRGTICFINDFDMQSIKRFYKVKHPEITTKRGWRGHRIEQRWFHVIKGAFRISLVKIDDWEEPNPDADLTHFELSDSENSVLHVPVGYASSLQAIINDSEVIVFADFGVEHASEDDYLFPNNYFISD